MDILIIDDDAQTGQWLAAKLGDTGYRVRHAENSREGLDWLAANRAYLVIVGLNRETDSGPEILQEIRQVDPEVEVIVLAAHATAERAVEILRGDGVFDYFAKPLVHPTALLASVGNAVKKSGRISQRRREVAALMTRQIELSEQNHLLRRAQAALLKSDSRFRLISAIATDFFYTLTVDPNKRARFEWIGGAFYEMTGLDLDELMEVNNYTRRIVAEDMPAVIAGLRQVLANQVSILEYRFVTKTGELRWLYDTMQPVWDEDHRRVSGIVGAVRDVTEKRLTEKALRESEHRYRQLVESSPMPILMHCDGKIVLLNYMAAHTLGGASVNGFIGRPILDFVPEEDRQRFTRHMNELMAGDDTTDFSEERFIREDGIPIDVSIAGTAGDFEGKSAIQLIFYDITERKRMENRISHSRRMQALGELSGGIAHELNNALATVLGNIELLQMDFSDAGLIDPYVNPIKASIQRMGNLANQLLAYARGGKYKPRTLSVPQFLETTLPMLARSIDPELEIQTTVEENVSPIEVDVAQLQMSMLSVLENAHEALGEKGRICVRVGDRLVTSPPVEESAEIAPGNYVRIQIQDNGHGMDEQTRTRIFDPFFSTKFLGRGLGMAAVYGIVRNHGGWVAVDSSPGRGTTVGIYLPVKTQKPLAPKPARVEAPKGTGTLLLIEDEADVITVNRSLLKRLGYSVVEARTGKEAIEAAENHPGTILLALLDIKLPDMDGHQLYPELKKRRPDMKVILCTGYSIDGPTRRILDAGADDFLQKPFSLSQLAEKLKRCLADQ